MIQILEIIKNGLQTLGVNYEFMEWTSGLVYPYFVGEYEEEAGDTEDGRSEAVFMLTGTTRGSWLELETAKEAIANHFDDLRIITDEGNGVSIWFDRAFPVPTGEQDLKRIQINLNIKEWKVKN